MNIPEHFSFLKAFKSFNDSTDNLQGIKLFLHSHLKCTQNYKTF